MLSTMEEAGDGGGGGGGGGGGMLCNWKSLVKCLLGNIWDRLDQRFTFWLFSLQF